MMAKDNTVEKLEEAALRFKVAETIHRTEEDRVMNMQRHRPGGTQLFMLARTPFQPTYQSRAPVNSYRSNPAPAGPSHFNNQMNMQAVNPSSRNWRPRQSMTPRLSPERVAKYRAQGKCHSCREMGHTMKDCMKQNIALLQGLMGSAISYTHVNELEGENEGAKIFVGSLLWKEEDIREEGYEGDAETLTVCTMKPKKSALVLPPME